MLARIVRDTGGASIDSWHLLGQILAPADDGTADERLRARIEAGTVAWLDLVALASLHLVTPALHPRLANKNLLELFDGDLREYFATITQLNRDRNHRIRAQLLELLDHLNAIGIEPVLLKGTAHLAIGLYSDPAERVLADIDLLVPRERLLDAVAALGVSGYKPVASDLIHDHHHYPALGRDGEVAYVELHHELVPRFYRHGLSSEIVRQGARRRELEGRRAAVPCPEHLILHNVVHSQIINRNYWAADFLLRDLWDLVLLSRHFESEFDENQLTRCMVAEVGHGCAAFYMRRASQLFGPRLTPPLPLNFAAWLAEWRWQAHARGGLLPLQQANRMLALVLKGMKQARQRFRDGRYLLK